MTLQGGAVQEEEGTGALVLGIGNVLWADEGFGVRAVEALHDAYAFPPEVCLVDGGTQGLYLLNAVMATRRLIIFDAIDYGLPAGTLKVLRDAEVPAWGAAKMSMHQMGFHELLALAKLRGRCPESMLLVGVQPEDISDFGGSLRDCVKARIADAIAIATAQLAGWGFAPRRRDTAPRERLNAPSLALESYESLRPASDVAFRDGDARFLNLRTEPR
jgi:hydrogenase maturation protease